MIHASPLLLRRLVLGSALLAALVAAAALPEAPRARAATALAQATPDSSTAKEIRDAVREATREAQAEIAREAQRAADEAAEAARDARADADAARNGDVVVGGHRYGSFDEMVKRAPSIAATVASIVFVVFLTPILLVGLIIWYKLRKSRMQNETMLKLAEKGVMPTPQTLDAIRNAPVDVSLAQATSTLPPAEQVQVLAKRAAWTDLRKGVVMGAVGVALCVHGLMGDGAPGWIGLVLLFLGAGYIALWYFEERQAAQTLDTLRAARPPARGPGLE